MAKDKFKIIDYTSPEYADDKMKFMDDAMQAVFYNFSQEIMLRRDYWAQDLSRREKNHAISQGNILSAATKASMQANGIKPIEPNIVSTLINNLADSVMRAHFTGQVKSLFNDQAAISSADLDLLVKMTKADMNFDKYLYELAKLGISENFFPFLLVQIEDSDVGQGRMSLKLYKPDAVLPDMQIYNDGSEVDDIILIDWVDRKSLYIDYPDKKEMLDEFNSMWGTNNDYVASISKRAVLSDRKTFQTQFDQLKSMPQGTPLRNRDFEVKYTRLYKVAATVPVLINRYSSNEIIVTSDWTDETVNDFLIENPSYELVERLRYVVWETTMTTSGLCLRNRMYPVQIPTTARDVMLPGVCYVPNIIHGKPEGFIDVVKEDLINFAITASEEQYQMFSSGGKIAYVEVGAIDNPDSIRDELQNRLGVIAVNEGALSNSKIRVEPQQFNQAYTQNYNNIYQRIQEISGMSQEMQGRMQAGSSNYRTRTSILQSMSSHSPYIRNLTMCDVNLTNIILYLFCLTTTDEELFAVFDSSGEDIEISVNETEPEKVDGVWRLIRVMSDLRRGKFKYMITEQSTSSLSDEMEQEAHDAYMQGAGGHLMQTMLPLPGGLELVANIFEQSPNSITKRYGKALLDSVKKQKEDGEVAAQSGENSDMARLAGMMGGGGEPQMPQESAPPEMQAVEQPSETINSQYLNNVDDANPANYNQTLMNNLMNSQSLGTAV